VEIAKKTGLTQWTELFSGSGNFSLALADRGFDVRAFENDELGVEALERSIVQMELKNISANRVDIYHHSHKVGSLAEQGLLLDPPRSGLGKFLSRLQTLLPPERPRALIYVSCFPESFIQDVTALKELGFLLEEVVGVDQFPHSHHMEWIGWFRLP
jgi:23S rRNA (uracil1939-C5)-methyltransferase